MMARRVIAGRGGFNPKALFANGETGAWYDPSDFSTLFQDAAGTTPVTAVEQPVGLMLDKSKGLVLGPELLSSPSTWTPIIPSNNSWSVNTATGIVTATNTKSVSDDLSIGSLTGSFIGQAFLVSGNIISISGGSIGLYSSRATYGFSRNSPGKCYAVMFATQTGRGGLSLDASIGTSAVVANLSIRELPGCHAGQFTNTNYRPLLKQNANGNYYLLCNGSNNFLATLQSIDFTTTNKMSVFAGVRKLSDATNARIIAELSATVESNNGSFSLQGPNAADAATYLWQSKGTALTDAQATGRTAPITNILTGLGNIGGDSSILRINGLQVDSDSGDQGTGNYGNYPLYIGSRGGSSLFFNGHIYSLIVRGAQTPANLIAATERYVARKTGVTI